MQRAGCTRTILPMLRPDHKRMIRHVCLCLTRRPAISTGELTAASARAAA
ncbi:hypothetical protein ASAP_1327 [Asaia bogorensis]|uniref:Uncharacterized protein n=1 Tax=Asaia bogorensis TaxID=91915 RepID=A0A060QKC9_9PROT|nr:hypothetical protein P792_01670 [Asaia sp. SF2.1]CDG39372.1 hypothetical protein ASAP_1327 [Asaia bogorensis]